MGNRRKQEVSAGIIWSDAPEILSLRQAANLLGVGYETVRKLVVNGEVPNVRVGISYKIPKNGLWAWFNKEAESNVLNNYRKS